MKIKTKEKELNALQWRDSNDAAAEMKRFCREKCTITFETCCVDDYLLLKVLDFFKGDWVIVRGN